MRDLYTAPALDILSKSRDGTFILRYRFPHRQAVAARDGISHLFGLAIHFLKEVADVTIRSGDTQITKTEHPQ